MKVPNYANKIAEKYIIEKNATLKIYHWRASKGYHTKFVAVPVLAVKVVSNSTGRCILDRGTASIKTIKEWIRHFNKEFGLELQVANLV